MESGPLRNIASSHLSELAQTARMVSEQLLDKIVEVAELTHKCLSEGNKLMYCGNGGSAADAQHIATEYVVRYRRNRKALPAIALTTDTSLITAASNDYSFEDVFARQVEALGKKGDILFLHSTSGESENLIRAADAATSSAMITVGMLGRGGGRLAKKVTHALIVPTDNGAHAQELHLAISHIICEMVERRFADA